jgi:hypothetical protein
MLLSFQTAAWSSSSNEVSHEILCIRLFHPLRQALKNVPRKDWMEKLRVWMAVTISKIGDNFERNLERLLLSDPPYSGKDEKQIWAACSKELWKCSDAGEYASAGWQWADFWGASASIAIYNKRHLDFMLQGCKGEQAWFYCNFYRPTGLLNSSAKVSLSAQCKTKDCLKAASAMGRKRNAGGRHAHALAVLGCHFGLMITIAESAFSSLK